MNNKTLFVITLLIFLFGVSLVSAHQPRISDSVQTIVEDPEISKAYYSHLARDMQSYVINSKVPFTLYVNILVPDILGQKKDVSAAVIQDGNLDNPLAVLVGTEFEWKKFHEPFANDDYWKGPEYKANVTAGTYEIRVWSSNNDSKYSLAIGEKELFSLKEILNVAKLVPQIKHDFFNESPTNFIFSIFGVGYVVLLFLFSFLFGFLYRFLLKQFAKGTVRGLNKNINVRDRLLRVFIGIVLFLLAITSTWNPVLIFISGFCFFEAIFSWCGIYAALGKNTCPIDV